ncbi:APC family permease [Actinocrispum wychmicini]|uniref:Amino acid transporter n=1 Tax=Actinocrispum wychmicini TaxID=1213861 RepID=A0A4R2JF12_9PSEU|nr:APC family permease [Actinocrispum wychmicini]TCO54849.1 amino acid transporter [Actinocrispum wychmicini]
MDTDTAVDQPELRRNAIGLREMLFQSVTAMAPGAAIAASIPSGAAFAGGALPLSVLVALVACLFAALSIAELARHLPGAGSVATYTTRGLHPTLGFLVAWGYVFVEALVPTLLFIQLGYTVADTLHAEWNSYPDSLWWPWALLGSVIITVVGYRGVRSSARLGTILGAFEIIVFVALAVMLIVKAGGANTLSVFTTAHTPDAYPGITGVIAGSVYTVLAFGGFEAAAPLAEEAKLPRQTVRRAVVGATIGIGLIYILTTYAAAVFVGPDNFSAFGIEGPQSWAGISRASFGLFWILVFLAVVNSAIANANAGANVSTRTAFALARVGVFPRALRHVHSSFRSPTTAIWTQFVITLVTLPLAFVFTVRDAFYLLATIVVVVIASVYIVVNAACVGFFARVRRDEFNWLRHLVLPLLGMAAFVPALLTAAGIPVFSFVTPLTPPVSYAGIIVGVWMLLGIAYLVYLWTRHRQRVIDTGLVEERL